MRRFIPRLFVSMLAVFLLCCGVCAAAETGEAQRVTDVTVADGYALVLLDRQGDEVAQTTDGSGKSVFENVARMKLTIEETEFREYVVMLLDGGTKTPGADNIRFVDQKSGPGELEFLICPDRLDQVGEYTLMVFSGGVQSQAAAFRVAAEPEITGTINLKSAAVELAEEVYIHIKSDVQGFAPLSQPYLLDNMGLLAWPADKYPGDALAVYDNCTDRTGGATLTSDGYYRVRSSGIVSTKLGDELIMRVYLRLPNGNYAYSRASNPYSPQTYAVNKLNSAASEAKLKRLVAAMLDYGAAAQQYFGYRTGDLANAVTLNSGTLASYRTAYAQSMLMNVVTADTAVVGQWTRNKVDCPTILPSLELADRVNYQFKIAFREEIMAKTRTVTILVWDKAAYESLKSRGATFSEANATARVETELNSAGQYVGMYRKVNSNQIGNTLYMCAVAECSDGTSYNGGIAAYNAHKYASNTIASGQNAQLVALCKAMVVYSDRANAYYGF